jgi:hypothetical protein
MELYRAVAVGFIISNGKGIINIKLQREVRTCEISGSHSSEYEADSLLECCAV